MYKMSCPFLNRFSKNYSNRYFELLKEKFGKACPFMKNSSDSHSYSTKSLSLIPIANNDQTVTSKNRNCSIHECDKFKSTNAFPYEKCFSDLILKKKEDHSYRVFKKVNRLAGDGLFPHALEYTSGERPITVWCSNDYLGMTTHPRVKKAIETALEAHGSGAGGTRNISGNSLYHERLEKRLAELHKKESGLLFTSCFVANDSTLFTLAKLLPQCHIFSDEGNHASMIQGIKNSGAPKFIFRHNDPNHLEELLSSIDKNIPKIVAFETVHSMTGDISPLEEICDIAHHYGAITFVDEVHAVGLYGNCGAGIGEERNVLHKMDIISGTLGKAFGNIGGYIVSSSNLIDLIRSYAAGFIFTTSLPPTVVCGALQSVDILSSDEGRSLRKRHRDIVEYAKRLLKREGFPVDDTPSHIIPIRIGDACKSTQISDVLIHNFGHYIQAINYPTVPRGEEKLRLAPTPYHKYEMIDQLVSDMKQAWNILDIERKIPTGPHACMFCNKPDINTFGNYENTCICPPKGRCEIPNCPRKVAYASA